MNIKIAYLYLIRVESGPWQHIKCGEIQASGKNAVATRRSAEKKMIIEKSYVLLYFGCNHLHLVIIDCTVMHSSAHTTLHY